MPVFDVSEYRQRIAKTKEKMNSEGMEVLLVTNPANMNYLTGYDGWSFYVPQLLILNIEEEEPIWIGRGMDANGAKMTTWLRQENIKSYSDDYVQSSVKHPMNFVADILKEKRWANKSIGVEMDQYYFTARSLAELTKDLPGARFKDATLLVGMVRLVKSEEEISCMKRAARIVERAMQVATESIDAGVRQCDAAANICHAQVSGTREYGGDYPAIVPLVLTGEGASTAHLTWTDKKFERDQVTILELAGCYNHYHSPMCRTIYIGNPPHELEELSTIVIEGLESVLNFVRPGVTCEEVEREWREAVSKSRVVKESRLGYSMGLGYPPDWGEHTASLRPGDKTVLQPNMTFHIIPSIWGENIGFGISEAVRVTSRGSETIADFPRKLFVK